MRNLTQNQHGTYTFRKLVNNQQVRVSLRTSDKFEAIRIADKSTALISVAKSTDPNIVKTIVYSVVKELSPTFSQERLDRVQSLISGTVSFDKGMLLSDLMQRFIDEKLRSGAWASKTLLVYKVIYENLLELLGDKGVREINSNSAQHVKSCLQKLPANLNKKAQYKSKSLKQILKMDIPDSHLMSIKTINIKLGCYSELFKWGTKNSYVDKNMFEGVFIKDTRRARELRLPFTPVDLKIIFNSKQITNPKKPWHQWIPTLALYTGARLNELCQLQRKDIQNIQGIWCISINDDGQHQHIKAIASKRLIPLHNEILKLGFVTYCMGVSSKANDLIFPELTLQNDRYGHAPSKWFGRVKSEVLLNSDKKSFHSFRHTFIDYMFNRLKLAGNPIVKAIVGHSDNEVTSGVYGSSFEVQDLDRIIQRIDFSGENNNRINCSSLNSIVTPETN